MTNKNNCENCLIIDFKEKTTFGYNAIAGNYFVEKILKKQDANDLKSNHLLFRLIRTGMIGDILFKKGEEYVETEKTTETEFLAVLFESYMFLIRTVYDYLLHFLKTPYGVNESSFNDFVKKIRKGGYPEIKGKLRYYLEGKIFDEIRALRDSIKRQTPYIFIYIKDNQYHVDGTIYKRTREKEKFDDALFSKMFAYSSALFLLMSYIAENMTGVSLKEQIEYLKREPSNTGLSEEPI